METLKYDVHINFYMRIHDAQLFGGEGSTGYLHQCIGHCQDFDPAKMRSAAKETLGYASKVFEVSADKIEFISELEKLSETAGIDNIQAVIVDPSAASFIECIRRHGRFNVRKANNDVLSGIRRTSTLIKAGKILVSKQCKDFLREIKLFRWNEKSAQDSVIKENDHAMDDTRYLVNTVLKNTILRDMGGNQSDSDI